MTTIPQLPKQKSAAELCKELGICFVTFKRKIKKKLPPAVYALWYGDGYKRLYSTQEVEYLKEKVF